MDNYRHLTKNMEQLNTDSSHFRGQVCCPGSHFLCHLEKYTLSWIVVIFVIGNQHTTATAFTPIVPCPHPGSSRIAKLFLAAKLVVRVPSMIPRCRLRPPIVAGQGREISVLLKKV
jgi:hypothetical protein